MVTSLERTVLWFGQAVQLTVNKHLPPTGQA